MGTSDNVYGGGRRAGPPADAWARVVVDARGIVTEWSTAAQRLLGYPADRVVGRPVIALMAGADEVADVVGARGGGGPADGHVLVRHDDGGVVRCRLAVRPEPAGVTGPRWSVLLAPAGGAPEMGDVMALRGALFTETPVGVLVLGPDLRLLVCNPAAEQMLGPPAGDTPGQQLSEAWPGFGSERAEQVLSRVLTSGEPVLGYRKRARPPADPDREHVYGATAYRLEDAAGRVLGVAEVFLDVTERDRRQERLSVLATGARIGSTLDVVHTAQEFADLAVPHLADSVALEVLEAVLLGEELFPGPVGEGVVLRRAASRSRREDVQPGVYEVGEVSTFPLAAPSSKALADLRPRLVSPVRDDSDWVLRDPLRGRRMLEDKVHSLMLVPLVARDLVLGIVTLYRWSDLGPFTDDDLSLVSELAHRTALGLDNARRYVRVHTSLVSLQRSLLPQDLPTQDGLEVAHRYIRGGSGGDWVDVIPLSGARLALVAGGAADRGMAAAATMGRLRAAVDTLSDLDLEPDELLARLDDLVFRMAGDDGRARTGRVTDGTEGSGVGSTCLYLVYDPVSRHCSLASAGHPGPIVRYPDGRVETLQPPRAEPLGMPGPPFGTLELDLPEGALLTLYTPGLFQAYGATAGQQRLTTLLTDPPDLPDEACRAFSTALLPARPADDAALLVARTHQLGEDRTASWELPADPAVVATARSLVAGQLSSWGLDDAAFVTELIVSELVTNAIRHAKAPIGLRLIRGSTLTCEVSDGSGSAPRLRHAHTTDEGGRGLLLVAQFAERWGTRYTGAGKTIWTEQRIDSTSG
ncbi:SpoIIE family protein phosphatase [Streptomyces odontomachi]|uniref:SpoIIE family protein phosphatase n=1 Tax=Streptomyces odontomachi TaxID=2944940 RepID=UPI00272DE05D|nr:SpoIIE family protein phosphatase [Streptomyces sp. ODS25]